jgi:hypothetical protein
MPVHKQSVVKPPLPDAARDAPWMQLQVTLLRLVLLLGVLCQAAGEVCLLTGLSSVEEEPMLL